MNKGEKIDEIFFLFALGLGSQAKSSLLHCKLVMEESYKTIYEHENRLKIFICYARIFYDLNS